MYLNASTRLLPGMPVNVDGASSSVADGTKYFKFFKVRLSGFLTLTTVFLGFTSALGGAGF